MPIGRLSANDEVLRQQHKNTTLAAVVLQTCRVLQQLPESGAMLGTWNELNL